MHLYFIRHGQSFVNLEDWTDGNLDMGLTELGRRQAEALGRFLPGMAPQVDAIYASTMARARETAAAACVAYPTPIRFDDRLREIGNNRRDHAPWPPDALPVEYSSDWASAHPFASVLASEVMGESYMHFRTRVGIFIEEVAARHRGQTLLVICHGGVVDAAFDHIFNVGPWRRCEVWDFNTAVTYFEYVEHPGREVWRLHFHNRVEHLIE